MHQSAEAIQREEYARVAGEYDQLHDDPEHIVALAFLNGMLDYLQASSVLDVGAGTGRAMKAIQKSHPAIRLVGVEPVKELREVGHRNGIPESNLIAGDGYALPFADSEFDVVCEVAMLHHVREPNRIVAEMLRVARKAIFISDSNNFGGGGSIPRFGKQLIHALGLWPAVNYIKTAGKGYSITKGDGLFYSYSVFDSLKLIQRNCRCVHMLNTSNAGPNLYRTSSTVAILGIR